MPKGIDDKDIIIINSLVDNPRMSQEKLAQLIGLAQSATAMRIHKLQKKNLLKTAIGINFKKSSFNLGKIDAHVRYLDKLIPTLRECPLFLNGLIHTGYLNLCAMVRCKDAAHLDGICQCLLRKQPGVSNVGTQIVITSVNDLVMPAKLVTKDDNSKCLVECGDYMLKLIA